MSLAILQGDDYPDTVSDLEEHGIYCTLLNSSGGFLKKKSVTVMIGVSHEKLDTVLEILKKHARSRMETEFVSGGVGLAIPTQKPKGGTVVFVMNVESFVKY